MGGRGIGDRPLVFPPYDPFIEILYYIVWELYSLGD